MIPYRRVIQICIDEDGDLVALCDDGSIWRQDTKGKWIRVTDIPQG